MKIHPVGAELFHVGGRTDRHYKVNSHFHNFSKAPKKKETVFMALSIYYNMAI